MTIPKEPTSRSEVAGRDMDQARALFEDGYNGSDFVTELTDSDFFYRYTITGDSDMSLRSSTFLGSIKGTVQPEDEYVVSWITDGAGVYDVGADETPLVLGRPAMFPTGKRFEFEFSDYRQNLVHFGAGFLERIAAEHEGALPGPIHFDHAAVPDPDALRRWKSTITSVAKTLLGGEPTELALAEVKRLAAVALLETFPHETAPLPAVLTNPRNSRIRAAVEYMHLNSHLPITSTDIAKVADLSLRGLQSAFATQLGTTPTAYLRDIRLDRARADLLHLGPDETTVADVAERWGFAHSGRFSAAYGTRFGELPSETLRGSRG